MLSEGHVDKHAVWVYTLSVRVSVCELLSCRGTCLQIAVLARSMTVHRVYHSRDSQPRCPHSTFEKSPFLLPLYQPTLTSPHSSGWGRKEGRRGGRKVIKAEDDKSLPSVEGTVVSPWHFNHRQCKRSGGRNAQRCEWRIVCFFIRQVENA